MKNIIILTIFILFTTGCSEKNKPEACNDGDGDACYSLGEMYMTGQGVQKDIAKSILLYEKACDNDSAEGCAKIGLQYISGQGVKKDIAKAVQVFKKACDNGAFEGCRSLGSMYAKGLSVEQNSDKAIKLYTKACDGGDAEGCTNLGINYLSGKHIAKDKDKGIKFLTKACDGGSNRACAGLGSIYAQQNNPDKAIKTFEKACKRGDAGSCNSLKFLSGTPIEEIVNMEEVAKEATKEIQKKLNDAAMQVSDFILDYKDLENRQVCVKGNIKSVGEDALFEDIKNTMVTISLDTSNLPRDTRKEIMQKCDALYGCTNVVCGKASILNYGKGIIVENIKE